MNKTDELRTAQIDKLLTPGELAIKLPLSAEIARNVTASRRHISKILSGCDNRLLVIVGPVRYMIQASHWPTRNACRLCERVVVTAWKLSCVLTLKSRAPLLTGKG